MNQIRTVIVDDERYACERLKKLLTPFSQIEVLNYFTDSFHALEFIKKQKPELVFLDVELENSISAFDIIEELNETLHPPSFILVTAHAHYSIKAIKHEVFDYLIKPVDVDELEDTIDRFIKHVSLKQGKIIREFNMLSEREKSVLNHVLEGKSSSEIARLLYISKNTVNTHRRNILKKTGAGSVIELFRANNLQDEKKKN
jgi:two-component system LytT family response regulator